MTNIVKSEEDIICHGEQIEKNVKLDLDKIKFGSVGTRRIDLSNILARTIGQASITGIEIINNDTQDVIFNGKNVATISDKGIDFHIPITLDGVEIAECVVNELRRIEFKEMRTRGVV